MAYSVNPFLERRSERTTSDEEFTLVFSPKILEKFSDEVFQGGIHVFRSAPGGGKTTILRAFTPSVLQKFWRSKNVIELKESFPLFVKRGVLDEKKGPQLLGVMISCASGYADLPPGVSNVDEGAFRALLDCRVVLRAIRSLGVFLGLSGDDALHSIKLEYGSGAQDIRSIPKMDSALELLRWAEQQEKNIYAELDAFAGKSNQEIPENQQFECLTWLQTIQFVRDGSPVAANRLLMIDDLHRLRSKQRALLIDELVVQRPEIPVWFAMRTFVLGESLLSQGARLGRDIHEYPLEDLWKASHQFMQFAQNVLDRRMNRQDTVEGTFSQRLRGQLEVEELQTFIKTGVDTFQAAVEPYRNNVRYSEWITKAEEKSEIPTQETLLDLFVTKILIARDSSKKQLSFEMALSSDEIDDRDNSSLRGAAEIHLHEEIKLPYYFGLERLCILATYNIEELLTMAAALYEGIVAGQILREPNPELSPFEQEKILIKSANKRFNFIPKQHNEGARAQQLLESVGQFCRYKTFLPNAPYAPGVTGVRLSKSELAKLDPKFNKLGEQGELLRRVLSECIGENLLVQHESSATTSREAGSIYYLNRSICANFGLPCQMGGWQDVSCLDLIDWLTRGWKPKNGLEMDI